MRIAALLLTLCSAVLLGCKSDNPALAIFNPSNDVQLGGQLHAEVMANPQEYPLLDESANPEAYAYIQGLCDQVVATGELKYQSEFEWKVYIIDAEVLNAFAAPGGYLYFYTGLIKYLDEEDDLMGVMGHEIAHADRRHSVKQMTKAYGVSVLLSLALGENPSEVETILAGLAGTTAQLKFSRDDETEADEYSVAYLAETPHRCDAASIFFQKLEDSGQTGGTPTFLSTHPAPSDRVANIQQEAADLGCSTEYFAPDAYDEFKALLP